MTSKNEKIIAQKEKLAADVLQVADDALQDITVGEAMAQVEGRIHARKYMQRHYADLDNIFFGNVAPSPEPSQNTEDEKNE